MIQFSHYKYHLQPLASIGAIADDHPRKGALIRAVWPDRKYGFADCHPWLELGDADIDTQLLGLSQGRISQLMEQTIWLARNDAVLRAAKQNGLVNAGKIKNHFLVTDANGLTDSLLRDIKNAGFTTIKVKVGSSQEEEAKIIARAMKQSTFTFRFDFNSKSDFSRLERFLAGFDSTIKRRIEFVEDPFPFDEKSWAEASSLVPLAIDFEYENVDWAKIEKPPFKTIIIKPARMDVEKAIARCMKFHLKAAVTSSLDHPVGAVHAAMVASDIRKSYPNLLLDCGCLTMKNFRPNEFTNKVVIKGPYLAETHGYGIGFDDILETLDWKNLGER